MRSGEKLQIGPMRGPISPNGGMVMSVTVYQQTNSGVTLQNSPILVVQLQCPQEVGRMTVVNSGKTRINATTILTTLDGATILDEMAVSVAPGTQVCIVMQGTVNVSAPNSNEIVDIRCVSLNSTTNSCSLVAISVDQTSGSV
jgi:flagellar basal body rod protein FlgF